MPTPIKYNPKDTDDKDKLFSAIRNICGQIAASMNYKYKGDYDQLVKLAWTEDDIDRANGIRAWLGASQIKANYVFVPVDMVIDHPVLPKPTHAVINIRIDGPQATPPKLWPEEWLRGNPIPGLEELAQPVLHDLIKDEMDLFCIRSTLRFLVENCGTFEQALYLFPHFRAAIRESTLPAKYEDIEVRRAPSTLPYVNEQRRRMLKHAHSLMAMHVLLGTFDTTGPGGNRDKYNCSFTLLEQQRFEVKTEAGLVWDYEIGER